MKEVLSIEVTTKCNLQCINCFAHADGSKHNHISLETAKEILKEGAEIGFTRLSITGGEPFLWPYLFELLEYARILGFCPILINSNAHLLDEETCSKLSQYGKMLDLSCSINGTETEHDSVRGSGSYKKAITGIKNGLKHDLNIHVFTVINRKNLETLPHFTNSLFTGYPGIKNLVFIQLRGIDNDYYQVENLKLKPEEFIEMVKMTGYLSLSGFPVQILENSLSTVVAKLLGLTWLPLSEEISRPGKIVVLQDGTMTVNHSSSLNLGMYTRGMLKTILESEKYKETVGENRRICPKCEYLNMCRSNEKIRPSSRFHNTGDGSTLFCQKVIKRLV